MESQKMRRTLLLNIPRNVSRREYAIYTAQCGLVFIGFIWAAGMLVGSLRGDARRTVVALAEVPLWTVGDAAKSQAPVPLIKLEAELVGSNTVALPDEPEVEVVLGTLELTAKTIQRGRETREAVLHRWEHSPDSLWLLDGEERIALDIERDRIPRTKARGGARPERLTDGAGARLSKTVGYRFLEQDWSLPEQWGPVSSAIASVDRSFVSTGSRFVVTGRLEQAAVGAVLIATESSGGSIYAGSLEEIEKASERVGSVLRFGWLPLLAGSVLLLRRVLRIRRDFVRRSNEG